MNKHVIGRATCEQEKHRENIGFSPNIIHGNKVFTFVLHGCNVSSNIRFCLVILAAHAVVHDNEMAISTTIPHTQIPFVYRYFDLSYSSSFSRYLSDTYNLETLPEGIFLDMTSLEYL